MLETKKSERTNASKEVKRTCKEFGFTAGTPKGLVAEVRKPKEQLVLALYSKYQLGNC